MYNESSQLFLNQASVEEKTTFYRKTYLHVALAFLAFVSCGVCFFKYSCHCKHRTKNDTRLDLVIRTRRLYVYNQLC